MQARRAARELALIVFSQFDTLDDFDSCNFQDIILKSVRTLANSSMEDIESSAKDISALKEYIESYEAEHPDNIARPIGVSDKPVPLPMTDDMVKKLDNLLDIEEKTVLALEIAELAVLEEKSDVKAFVKRIIKEFIKHKEEVDGIIQRLSDGWDISRLVKMDKAVLRIAVSELLYLKETPVKAAINEAVELAKKYSTDDSASFVNGVLAKVVLENNLN